MSVLPHPGAQVRGRPGSRWKLARCHAMTSPNHEELRRSYASAVTQAAGVRDPRVREAFATIPREKYLPPPPWTTISLGVATQTSDIADIYENVLVAIDRKRGINNGEPALHAAWLETVHPVLGETAIHVGAGTGYYTALLAHLVGSAGQVEAYEYEADLAAVATQNLSDFPWVRVHAESALERPLKSADLIYVNAGVRAPDPEWLKALKPDGRLIFPWQPRDDWGPTLLVTRCAQGFRVKPLMMVGFISCSGAPNGHPGSRSPKEADLLAVRSLWLREEREPDRSALAAYEKVWFSSRDLAA